MEEKEVDLKSCKVGRKQLQFDAGEEQANRYFRIYSEG